jgi:hypothetical protein
MRTGFVGKYSLYAVLAGLGLMAWTSLAVAQGTLGAGSVSGTAGQTVGVPITLNTGSDDVDFFAVTFTVVAQGGATAITTALTYTPADDIPKPDLSTAVPASGELAIGYVGLATTLSGVLQVGTLNVPVPAGATGSYVVQLSKISAGDLAGNRVTLTGANGAITLGGEPTATPTTAPTPGPDTLSAGSVSGTAGQAVGVPITLNTGSDDVDFFAVTFTVVAQGGATAITTALTYTPADDIPKPDLSTAVPASGELAIGYVGLATTLSGVLQVGTLNVPVPAGSTGSYAVQLSKLSAGDLAGNRVTLTAVNGAIALAGPTAVPTTPTTVVNTPTPVPPTATATTVPTATATTVPTATATTAPTATATATKAATATATKGTPSAGTATPTVAPESTLATSITATSTTITLVDASSFPSSGTIVIDYEQISYTGKSGNQLTGVTRGVNGTTAAAHLAGATVTLFTPSPCPTCEDNDSCQISANGHGYAWVLLIPAVGLLVMRRRRR